MQPSTIFWWQTKRTPAESGGREKQGAPARPERPPAHDRAAVVAVRRLAGEQAKENRGNELREPHEAEVERRVREVVPLPADRDALHLHAEHRADARRER